ncbi:MAG: bifunctional pyr operon transcriptional regulator/uracil phosphoribosyltransferase PyrR [Deltaproteobacteria bacterium]|jgi:pyrimidine operon attenuation protein/uracil phosphoribosyltransferase|nr:bifunctional pyr operon transcriptional regulator/uracil phosphoribosyltransferase PyrR [Deltaproteobacteria bacterium]
MSESASESFKGSPKRTVVYGPEEVENALTGMAADILRRKEDPPVLVGIRRGGVRVAERLGELVHASTGKAPLTATVDINFYRDDWTRARSFPEIGPTRILFSLEGKRVILVDDVLYTGRTVRAALDALTEFGRPAGVELAVLVDRGHRQMPVKADYAPFAFATDFSEIVEVSFNGPERLGEVVLISPKSL